MVSKARFYSDGLVKDVDAPPSQPAGSSVQNNLQNKNVPFFVMIQQHF